MREVRLSPDGDSVAIRTDEADPDSRHAWGVMRVHDGGCMMTTLQVADWTVLQ